MLAFLSGIVEEKLFNPNRCVINVRGLGFLIYVSQRSWNALRIDSEAKLFTSLNLSMDSAKIYGFKSQWEQSFFDLLSSIKGIGARSALSLIDGLSAQQITQAVATGSDSILVQAPGIGKKIAERIIFELKPRLGELEAYTNASGGSGDNSLPTGKFSETENILRSLGYANSEIEKALKANAQYADGDNVDSLLKACLSWLNVN